MHTRRLVACAFLTGLACGENVLVSRWEFGLKAEDAGLAEPPDEAAPAETSPAGAAGDATDAGLIENPQADSAERARVYAHENDGKSDHDDSAHSSDDKPSH